MKVRIKRIDPSLPLPKFETSGAVGFDLTSRETIEILPSEIKLIPTNLIIEVPQGYALILAPRSSMPRKTGLCFPHSIGVIDQDFCGPEDELMIQVQNMTQENVVVNKGDRIAQGMFVKIEKSEWEEIEEVTKSTRGGFGSSGGYSK